ncbi:hypothetical protein WKW77_13240 [Variovorax ureilyticus]|uniref:Lipoprotein n=1 Tax=Variovorax ureilyticus TaxID=1836198 RepID=A0ABU8VEF1_9BURK
MKPSVIALLALCMCLLAGCASRGSAGAGAASSGGSGITVFGEIDAGVNGARNQSR